MKRAAAWYLERAPKAPPGVHRISLTELEASAAEYLLRYFADTFPNPKESAAARRAARKIQAALRR